MEKSIPRLVMMMILIPVAFLAGALMTIASGIPLLPQVIVVLVALLLGFEGLCVVAIRRAGKVRNGRSESR